MKTRWSSLLAIGLGLSLFGVALATNPNEREVKPRPNREDTDDITQPNSKIWVLDFKFKDPRSIKVDIPGRGQRVCWYLWYQVINNTGAPRTFVPDFELVTKDKNSIHRDQILPKSQKAIQELEDPSDFLKIKNSVSITAEPIPPSKPEATPKAITGVAIWDDVPTNSNYFNIFVAGLSNGVRKIDAKEGAEKDVVLRKTLRLEFQRVGDGNFQDARDIRFKKAEWIYRPYKLRPIDGDAPKAEAEDKPPPATDKKSEPDKKPEPDKP
jgi:hypothetical protein